MSTSIPRTVVRHLEWSIYQTCLFVFALFCFVQIIVFQFPCFTWILIGFQVPIRWGLTKEAVPITWAKATFAADPNVACMSRGIVYVTILCRCCNDIDVIDYWALLFWSEIEHLMCGLQCHLERPCWWWRHHTALRPKLAEPSSG